MAEKPDLSREKLVYKLLFKVFVDKGYSTIILDEALRPLEAKDKSYVTRLFYGVLEKSVQFDYIIAGLSPKKPQKPVAILLKIGLYMLRFMDTPAYAAVDKTVTLAREIGKGAVSGFINAVLRRSVSFEVPHSNLSAFLSYPEWVINRLKLQYDEDFIVKMLSFQVPRLHVRRNALAISKADFEEKLISYGGGFIATKLGYHMTYDALSGLKKSDYTFQSLSSMLAVKAYLSGEKTAALKVLDLCAAPGGKAIYLKELMPKAEIICCDIHSHRLELIKKYAARLGTQGLQYKLNDAAVFNLEWRQSFDLVICDVPCSGLGVKSKPDVLVNRQESDIAELAAVQAAIIGTAGRYVKKGGALCYSTCTILKDENENIIQKFNTNNGDFAIESMQNLYPHINNTDGFFVAKLRRKND